MDNQTIEEGKSIAIIAYITIFGSIIAFFMNHERKNPFIAFHLRQGLSLSVCYLIIRQSLKSFDSWWITLTFWSVFLILYIYGIMSAVKGKTEPIPVIGEFFQKIMKTLGL